VRLKKRPYKGYFGETKLDVVKFKSKKGKDYLRLIELPEF
jgi:hypothetical protein